MKNKIKKPMVYKKNAIYKRKTKKIRHVKSLWVQS